MSAPVVVPLAPGHTVTVDVKDTRAGVGRLDATCTCGDGVDTSNNPFGEQMVLAWVKGHTPKRKGKR